MRVLYFGTYSVGPGYPRNTVLIESLKSVGVEVVECHAPLFGGTEQKIAAVSTFRGAVRMGLKAVRGWARLARRFYKAGPRDVVVVGYTGHLDLFWARVLGLTWRRPIVLDAFLSPYDTVVGDRRLLDAQSLAARALFAFERCAMRLSDLVLTDTEVGADFLAETFGVARNRFVAMPVGSLVRAPLKARVPVATNGGTPDKMPFEALFAGTFVPLQGIPYILDAAAEAPDIMFRIIGDGPGAMRIEDEVRRRGMSHVSMDRRFVPRDELDAHLARAGAVLGVFGETPKAGRVIPCKVYDGLAAGLPVVTGDSAAARELLTDGKDALLVDRREPRSLVDALRRLRDDERLGERLREGARRLARQRFGREALGLRLKATLKELIVS